MNARTFYGLAAAALVALVAAIWINVANSPIDEDSATKNQPLLPELRDQVNAVDSITLTGAGNQVRTTLKRETDGWRIVEKSNYPADPAKLRGFLLKLVDASIVEQKTTNPKRYADLGVDDVAAKDAQGVLVTLGGLKQPLKLIVGLFNGQGGNGTFVRRDGAAQSSLASGNLLAEKDAVGWMKHELLDIDAARIKSVLLTGPDGRILRVTKEQPSDASFKVADIPKGRELASDFVANSLGTGLANLRVDDVASAKDATPGDKVYKVHYVAFDGIAVDATAWDTTGKSLVQFVASVDAAQLDASIAAQQAKEKAAYETAVATAKLKAVEAKGDDAAIAKAEAGVAKPAAIADPAKDRADRQMAAAKSVDELNKILSGWTFTVPAYVFANFNKSMDDMLKPLPSKAIVGTKPADVPGRGAGASGLGQGVPLQR